MLKLSLTLLSLSCMLLLHAQDEKYEERNADLISISKPNTESVVREHKNNLTLTLIIDSIIIGNKKITASFRTTIPISFESDYIRVNDSLYLKIFIARNQEYGSKFYTWKWDFLKKKNGEMLSQGNSMYEIMDFGHLYPSNGSVGHGVGVEGTAGYVMYYYRYKLE